MVDILLLLFEVWWKGIVVAFILRGVYVASDGYSYDNFGAIVVVSVLWPGFVLAGYYEWLQAITVRPWYYFVVTSLVLGTSWLLILLWGLIWGIEYG